MGHPPEALSLRMVMRIPHIVFPILFSILCASLFFEASAPHQSQNLAIAVRHFEMPPYDPLARQTLIEGDVRIRVYVHEDGIVEKIKDVRGPDLLAAQVVNSVKKWTFLVNPPQPSDLEMTFRFSLKGEKAEEIKSYRVSGEFPGLIEITTNPPTTSWPGR
jgi:hypothetical protein